MRRIATPLSGLLVLLVLFNLMTTAAAQPAPHPYSQEASANEDPTNQTPELFLNEANAVYLANLERRKAGLPPLRWNRELTLAARWFAWDSIVNRPANWIGHQDSQGGAPLDRARRYGYLGSAGAENAARNSAMLTPAQVIDMWMNSPGHRANLLDPNASEIGLGYYYRPADGNTYVVQDFGSDSVAPPLVIENEAPSTTAQQVNLYQYSTKANGGLTNIGPAVQMMISNAPNFAGASWQPYQAEIGGWTLAPGNGWKTVYVRVKDSLGRTVTTSDSIYQAGSVPPGQMNLNQLSQTSSAVTLYCLNGAGMNKAQYSLDWAEGDENFALLWGSGGRAADGSAMGGAAFRLDPANQETAIWGYVTDFIPDVPMVAYFRLKTSSSSDPGEVVRIMVEANEVKQTVSIKGTDFHSAGQYQDFAVPFTYHVNSSKPFLIFQVWRSGAATIFSDDVTVFTTSQPFAATLNWALPGGHYRGQGTWVRYANDGGAFTGLNEVPTAPQFTAHPNQYSTLVKPGQASAHQLLQVNACGGQWSVASAPAWLGYAVTPAGLEVWGNGSGLGNNRYQGTLVLQGSDASQKVNIALNMTVTDNIYKVGLPITRN